MSSPVKVSFLGLPLALDKEYPQFGHLFGLALAAILFPFAAVSLRSGHDEMTRPAVNKIAPVSCQFPRPPAANA